MKPRSKLVIFMVQGCPRLALLTYTFHSVFAEKDLTFYLYSIFTAVIWLLFLLGTGIAYKENASGIVHSSFTSPALLKCDMAIGTIGLAFVYVTNNLSDIFLWAILMGHSILALLFPEKPRR